MKTKEVPQGTILGLSSFEPFINDINILNETMQSISETEESINSQI